MYKLHCGKCDNVIEPNENYFKVNYVEIFGVGGAPAVPRRCEVCVNCFNEFKRAVDWELDPVDTCVKQ